MRAARKLRDVVKRGGLEVEGWTEDIVRKAECVIETMDQPPQKDDDGKESSGEEDEEFWNKEALRLVKSGYLDAFEG